MPIKKQIVTSEDLDSLIAQEKWEDAIRARARQVKWLYNNKNRMSMVVDEKLVWLMVQSLQNKIKELQKPIKKIIDPGSTYDEFFEDERICQCGHLYKQHFDSAENMRHIGCKYCRCYDFKETIV